jgi:chitin disaccharide deacetylase
MPLTKRLIVNADDFGQSTGVNAGIIEAFERGIVTSASLMVRWPAACEAARYAQSHPDLSVGLHLDLGEWVYRLNQWTPLYEVVHRDAPEAVAEEISKQLSTFRTLIGRTPTHIDSHQHTHRVEPVCSILKRFAREIDVPLRLCSDVRYCGGFYGQTGTGASLRDNISLSALLNLLATLPPGTTELGCHPATHVDFDTMYRDERLLELQVLCNCRVREFLAKHDIELCSFHAASALLR